MNGYDYTHDLQKAVYAQEAVMQMTSPADRRKSILDENAEALEALASLLIDLEDRLSPVMRHEFDMPDVAGGHPEPPATTIRIQLNTLRSQAQRVKSILDRLEV